MSTLPIQPLQDFVLLQQIEAADVSAGGIILPDSAKKSPDEGVVLAKAADATDDVDIGDRVIYKKFSGTELKFSGEVYRLVSSADLLAKYVRTDAIPE